MVFLPWGIGRGEGNGPDESVLAVDADLRARFFARVKPELYCTMHLRIQHGFMLQQTHRDHLLLSSFHPPFLLLLAKDSFGAGSYCFIQAFEVKQPVVEALVLSSRA